METLKRSLFKDLKQYPEKVLQFGEGNFLRAFVDWQVNELNKHTDFNGSVVVVQPRGQGKTDRLNQQDGLYTLFLQGMKDNKAVKEHCVISSISRGMDLFNHYDEYLKLAHNPDLRFIVSNTTEAGISFDPQDQLEDRPQKSFPAKLTVFLYERFQAFRGNEDKGFIIIPCELIEKNGEKLKALILKYAELWNLGDAFVEWIHGANTFCNSMVDRIVPGYPVDTIDAITEELGYVDDFLVVSEQYHLWVIEGPLWIRDEFPVHQAGLNTIFVEDMTPYRTRKVRILNGAHTAMTPVAYLFGLNTVSEAVEHVMIGRFIKELIDEEIIPTLSVPSAELHTFAKDVINRFRNPFIQHYLLGISLNSIAKFRTRNLPSLIAYYNDKQRLPNKLVFSFAALLSFYKGNRGEEEIKLSDDEHVLVFFKDQWKQFDGTMASAQKLVKNVLGREDFWEQDLNEIPGLMEAVSRALYAIESKGMQTAVESVLDIND